MGLKGYTRDLQGHGKVYMGLQGYTTVYRGYTRVYKGLQYTSQLFLRYKRDIFILGVLGFLKKKSSEEVRRRPKSYDANKRELAPSAFHFKNQRSRGRYCESFIHFTGGFRSLYGSELTYFWTLCQARRQQLTFFNQA